MKKMSTAFTTVSDKLKQLKEAESDLSGSEAEEESSPLISSMMTVSNSPN